MDGIIAIVAFSVAIRIMVAIFIVYACLLGTACALIYPEFSVLQISAGISAPLELPERKMFMNFGFQFNYNMPFNFTYFYRPMYFPYSRALLAETRSDLVNATSSHKDARLLDSQVKQEDANQSNDAIANKRLVKKTKLDDVDQSQSDKVNTISSPPKPDASNGIETRNPSEKRHRRDLSAGELYTYFENTLIDSGYDETCLLKSVCQLARHPLHIERNEENLLVEMLNFLLTPSMHQSFDEHEKYQKEKYVMAEEIGTTGGDCNLVYSGCDESLLDRISFTVEDD